jgi:hypothetical protein
MPLASLEDASCREEIQKRLEAFHPHVERRWGVLTPGGVVCHLAASYEMATRGTVSTQRPGPLQRTVVRYFALHTSVRWPRGVPTLPQLVEGAPGVRPQDFDQDRARLMAAYKAFGALKSLAGRVHPIFGPLTHWEWMRWGYLHADHHLRQFGL